MRYTYELFNVEGGYGFHILCDGNITITQEYMPHTNGFIVMDEDIAIECANEFILRLEA